MAGDECIATLYVLRRTYQTPDGPRECIEPFEWHANEDWRAQAPGLRLIKHYMKGPRPLVAVAGTDAAGGLLARLRWKSMGHALRFVLPLSGRYLRTRGRSTLLATAFDVIGRPVMMPRPPRRSRLSLSAASGYDSGLGALVGRQRRFGLMRYPDNASAGWLQSAPRPVGHYSVLHARIGDQLVGWVLTRVFTKDGLRVGELLEVFLDDEFRSSYRDLVAAASSTLRGFDLDLVLATTNCPDTTDALKRLRFRPDHQSPVFIWWGKETAPEGPVLVDGAISDHAFFPVPSAEEATKLEASETGS